MGLEIPAILNSGVLPEMALKDQQAVSDRSQARQASAQALDSAELEAQLKVLEKTFLAFNHKVKLTINEEIDQVVIKVLDGDTDKVIREFPAEEIQRLIARIKETIGILVDEKI
jgi:flagellar protein FlaG